LLFFQVVRVNAGHEETETMRLIFFALVLLLSAVVAGAQSLEEVDKRRAALIEAWQQTPLTIRKAIFVKGEPRGFGLYEEHPSNEFRREGRRLRRAGRLRLERSRQRPVPTGFYRRFCDQGEGWRNSRRQGQLHADRD